MKYNKIYFILFYFKSTKLQYILGLRKVLMSMHFLSGLLPKNHEALVHQS